MSADAINFLKGQGFNQVVSLNSIELSHEEKNALAKAGIEYIHIKTDDFSAPDREKLLQAVTSMKGKNTYVYCDYGAGRTGTLVSAWKILNNKETL
ncbi:protein-tyrosine phosphatase family protein [Vibrio parahaemolyticus]